MPQSPASMTTYTVRRVENPSDAYIESMTDVLHEAFGRGFFSPAVDGKEENSRDLLKHHIAACLIDPNGQVWAASDDASGAVLGVAVWFGPGAKYLATPEQHAVGWDALMAKLPKEQQDWWIYFLDAYDEFTDRLLGPGVKLAGYHLQVIGVAPDWQRKGIARAFFNAAEEQAKASSVCTCLETAGKGAVPVYESLGYETKGPTPIKTPADASQTFDMYAFVKKFP